MGFVKKGCNIEDFVREKLKNRRWTWKKKCVPVSGIMIWLIKTLSWYFGRRILLPRIRSVRVQIMSITAICIYVDYTYFFNVNMSIFKIMKRVSDVSSMFSTRRNVVDACISIVDSMETKTFTRTLPLSYV